MNAERERAPSTSLEREFQMPIVKLWLPALVGVLVSLAPASALPIPKLPPEATNKPSVVVRVRPLAELLKDGAYVAKLIGQDGVFGAVEPAIQPIIDVIDTKKPFGFYAKVGPAGIDSNGVVLVPVKNQNDVLALLKTFGREATEGAGGLYSINVPGAPPVVFRFANGYLYGTVKNTPDAEAGLLPNKLYPPEALFKQGDDSLFSVTFNVDAVPNDLKRKSFEFLEEGLKHFNADVLPAQSNPVVRGFLETAAEAFAIRVQTLIVDTQTVTISYDFDRTKEDMSLNFRLTPRPNTVLANDLITASSGKSIGAGVVSSNSAANIFANVAVAGSVKKALEPLVDDLVAQGWKKAKDPEQPYVKELLEILAPTVKAGVLDFAADIRGPNADKHLTVLTCVHVKDANRLESLARKIHAILPPDKKAVIRLDVDKAAGIALHQFPAKLDPNADNFLGSDPQAIVAFRKDAIVFAIGPVVDATAAVKSSLDTLAKAGPAIEGMAAIRALAPVFDRKHPGMAEAAKKAYPSGISDAYRLSVTSGQNLDVRLSASTRLIQFGVLMEQSRRNR
jgi:hypothetical protein